MTKKRVTKIRTQGSRMRSANTTSEQSRLSKPKKRFFCPKTHFVQNAKNFFCQKKKFRNIFGSEKKRNGRHRSSKGRKKSEFFSPELLFRNKKKLAKVLGLGNVYFLKMVMSEVLLCHSNQSLICATAIQKPFSC